MPRMSQRTVNNLQKRAQRAKLQDEIKKLTAQMNSTTDPVKKAQFAAKRGQKRQALDKLRIRRKNGKK